MGRQRKPYTERSRQNCPVEAIKGVVAHKDNPPLFPRSGSHQATGTAPVYGKNVYAALVSGVDKIWICSAKKINDSWHSSQHIK